MSRNQSLDHLEALQATVTIVGAYARDNRIKPEDLPGLVTDVFHQVGRLQSSGSRAGAGLNGPVIPAWRESMIATAAKSAQLKSRKKKAAKNKPSGSSAPQTRRKRSA